MDSENSNDVTDSDSGADAPPIAAAMAPADLSSNEHPFRRSQSGRARVDLSLRILFCVLTYFIVLCAGLVFFDITWKGAPVLFPKVFGNEGPLVNTDLIFKDPETLVVFEDDDADKVAMGFTEFTEYRKNNPDAVIESVHTHSYSAGGVWGPLVGTVFLVMIGISVALFIGIATAVYLNEYSSKGKLVDGIRLAILNLAGVPSIVFGLFGMIFFCFFVPVITQTPIERPGFNPPPIPLLFDYYLSFQGWGTSMLAGGFTLAAMILPVIITATEESLKAVPMGFREASLALGATKWQTIRKSVVPYAYPGILTASVLGITRVAGETAPIMFTAAVAHRDVAPWEGLEGSALGQIIDFLSQSVQALPYHIYTVASRIPQTEYTEPMQYAAVFIFMLLVMGLSGLSVFLRIRARAKLKW